MQQVKKMGFAGCWKIFAFRVGRVLAVQKESAVLATSSRKNSVKTYFLKYSSLLGQESRFACKQSVCNCCGHTKCVSRRNTSVIVVVRILGGTPGNRNLIPTGKGKAVPLHAWTGPWGIRKVKAPDFHDVRHYEGGKVVSLTHRPSLPPGILLVLIFRGSVDPRAHGSVGIYRKNPQWQHWGSIPRPSD
jgi:hypothetical protein